MLIDGDKSRKTFKRPLWRGGFYGRSCGSVVPPRSLRRNLREAILNMRTSRPNLSPEPPWSHFQSAKASTKPLYPHFLSVKASTEPRWPHFRSVKPSTKPPRSHF